MVCAPEFPWSRANLVLCLLIDSEPTSVSSNESPPPTPSAPPCSQPRGWCPGSRVIVVPPSRQPGVRYLGLESLGEHKSPLTDVRLQRHLLCASLTTLPGATISALLARKQPTGSHKVVKTAPANAGGVRDAGSIPELGRFPEKERATHSSITPGQRSLAGYGQWGHKVRHD